MVHEPRRLFPDHLTVVEGIAVTSIVRTVFDLSPTQHPQRTKRLVHHVLRRHPGALVTFHAVLEQLAVRGKGGIVTMREILAALPIGSVPAGSGNELRFEEILEAAHEPPLRRQVSLGGQEFLGIFDYVDDELALVFEINSRTYHELLPEDRERDIDRAASMTSLGARVVPIAETLLWRDPAAVVRIVREERRRRRAELLVLKP